LGEAERPIVVRERRRRWEGWGVTVVRHGELVFVGLVWCVCYLWESGWLVGESDVVRVRRQRQRREKW
jgi:hypothetical protein